LGRKSAASERVTGATEDVPFLAYLVLPNLANCQGDANEAARGLAMNQLAGVLTDLDLIRWPRRDRWWGRGHEPKELLDEETGASLTDLTKVRQERLRLLESAKDDDKVARPSAEPIRNHGLFSKAEVALGLAGWSPKARADIEVLPARPDRRPDAIAHGAQSASKFGDGESGRSRVNSDGLPASNLRCPTSRQPATSSPPPLDAGHHALHFALVIEAIAHVGLRSGPHNSDDGERNFVLLGGNSWRRANQRRDRVRRLAPIQVPTRRWQRTEARGSS